ncbi:hypothetical protein [Streptomyces sp. NPDC056468]|uniref:hypothetical protein n=1 Tax=Streptomyces sp. NPDC056468 TaxID=3345830 RepID=UPI00367A82DD
MNLLVRTVQKRVERNSLPVSAWEDPEKVDQVLHVVDTRLDGKQAAAILDWIRHRPRGGPRLHAFFATLHYCGPWPEEAVAMRVEDVILPGPDAEGQWCELLRRVGRCSRRIRHP